MTKILDSYAELTGVLGPVLDDLPGKIVGIDGRNGVGKTTLGRYLAWTFNISLLESEFFLPNPIELNYEAEPIRRLIDARIMIPRPIIVEGIGLWKLLRSVDRVPDFVIYCSSSQYPDGNCLEETLLAYESEYDPKSRADICINNEPNDS